MLIATNLLKVKYLIEVVGDKKEKNVADAQTTENDKVAGLDMTDDNVGDHKVCFFDWV